MRYLSRLVILGIAAVMTAAAIAPARAAEGGPPRLEFADTFWVYCENSCDEKVYWRRIHIREDGSMGYQVTPSDDMIYDGSDRWMLVGPHLVLMWTNGEAVEVYDVGFGGRQEYRGLHSGVNDISIIRRAAESGGTLPEP